ncbi:BTAD domain-containing putative transcriptional regulator [Kitasatospora sp. NPDC059811]|uniref:AfsR/SARP family transcriptional regulator n=1 Tax=Streptomycetaceae TaxID=2062 RepID=UPI0009A08A9D|nr:BTAD domain-containing putative transcriptional regulator [Streptomyces sp. MJM8645]
MRPDHDQDSLSFALLGTLRVRRAGTDLQLGGPQQRSVLAALLLRPNAVVTVDELIADLWGDQPPGAPDTVLRTYVWQLRNLLEPVRTAPTVLISRTGGYRLAVEPDRVDVWQVKRLQELAGTCAAERPQDARNALGEALAQWRGEPLAGLPGPLMCRERERLSRLRLTLLEERLALDVALDVAPDVALDVALDAPSGYLPELEQLAGDHPLHERLQELLIRALHRQGRTSEARAVYDALRLRLVEQLGIEPGPVLTELCHDLGVDATIRSRTGAPGPDLRPDVPLPPESADRGADSAADREDLDQLPPVLPQFIGRQDHVARIGRALTGQAPTGRTSPALRLVTVTGMAGVGKTTLAVRAAHTVRPDFPDGRLYADLRGADLVPANASDILADFLTTLGVRAAVVPKDLESRAALFRTASAGRRLLILLDNARDEAQIQPLLPGSSDCAVIVTSRAVLTSVPSVLNVALDVFSEPEAIGLLDSVIGAARRSEQGPQARMLVDACGRLPLAVRIAAARLAATPDQPIAELVRSLADDREGIDALRTGDLAIEQVFELSYRLLPPPLATAFRMLSWAEPDLGLASAAAVLGLAEYQAERLAESLVDQALLESMGAGRYRYHDLVRAFARRASLRTGDHERAGAQQRLLTHLLGCARTAFTLAVPGDPVADVFGEPLQQPAARPGRPPAAPAAPASLRAQVSPVFAAAPVFADLADARRWARTETPGAVALAAAVATDTLRVLPDGQPSAMTDLRAAVNLLIALSPLGLGAVGGRAEDATRTLIAAAVAAGDRCAEGRSRFLLGTVLLARARLGEAGAQARQAAEACREAEDPAVLRQALNDLGLIAQAEGRHEEAIAAFDEAVVLARQLGHRSGEVASTANAALSRIRTGHAATAVQTCQRILAEPGGTADVAMTAYVHYVLGLAYQELGRLDDAAAQLQSCICCAGVTGDLNRESAARSRLADVLRLLGRLDEAVQQAERALDLAEEGGRQRERALAHLVLAHAMTARGDHHAARHQEAKARLLLSRLSAPEAADVTSMLAALATADRTPHPR